MLCRFVQKPGHKTYGNYFYSVIPVEKYQLFWFDKGY